MSVRFSSSSRGRPGNAWSISLLLAFLGGAVLPGAARGQDSLTVGTGSARSGSTASVPVYLRDVSGTPLGGDAGAGNRIQSVAFRVIYAPVEAVTTISFARAGTLAALTPYYERTLPSGGSVAYVAWFSDPIPLTLNAAAPGNQIGTLSVNLSESAASGTTVTLTIESSTAILGNRAGAMGERVASGTLNLVSGTASVVTTITAPTGLLATAVSTSQISLTWSAVGGATGYQVWRSSNNQPYGLVGSPVANSFSDTPVGAGTTYLYKVLAVDASTQSGFSNVDPATTVAFTDDSIIAGSTVIKASHILDLRNAIDAFRNAAGLQPASFSDLSLAGISVRAVHVDELRAAVNAARTQLSLGPTGFTDPALSPASTVVSAVHVMELRQSVK